MRRVREKDNALVKSLLEDPSLDHEKAATIEQDCRSSQVLQVLLQTRFSIEALKHREHKRYRDIGHRRTLLEFMPGKFMIVNVYSIVYKWDFVTDCRLLLIT